MCKDDAVVVIAFSFGSKGTKGNYFLGKAALYEKSERYFALYEKSERYFTVITQEDIPNIPRDKNKEGEDFLCPFAYVEDFMKDDGWHSTLWVANAAKLFCLYNKLPLRAVVIAAPMHLRRAVRDTKKAGFDVVCAKSPSMASKFWYEKKSELPWTRSWWRWWSREIPLRLLPWWLYRKLTLKQ